MWPLLAFVVKENNLGIKILDNTNIKMTIANIKVIKIASKRTSIVIILANFALAGEHIFQV